MSLSLVHHGPKHFNWENLFHEVIWMIIGSVLTRSYLWILDVPLDLYREIVFWLAVPLGCLLMLSLIGYLRKGIDIKPDLKGVIDNIIVGDDASRHSRIIILLTVSIRNLGSPSCVEGLGLHIKISGSSDFRPTKNTYIPQEIELNDNQGRTRKIFGKDALYNKVGSRPIAQGELVRGVLRFEIDHVSKDRAMMPGTKFRFNWKDIFGNEYFTEHTVGDKCLESVLDNM